MAFVLASDPPLLFTHQYNYFNNGLRIAEHAHPIDYVLSSDEWRAWVGGSTIAPLYYRWSQWPPLRWAGASRVPSVSSRGWPTRSTGRPSR